MKKILIAIFSISIVAGCSEADVDPSDLKTPKTIEETKKLLTEMAKNDNVKSKIQKTHTQITKKSILATFMDDLSKKNYQEAFSLINPKLTTAWTFDRFKKDLEKVRSAVKDWKPEATGSFTGNTPQGTYIQATYRLDSNWKSLASIDLVAMPINNENKIVKIHIRIPYSKETPKTVKKITEQFISAMQKKDYKSVGALMTQNCKLRFPPAALAHLQPILGKDSSKVFSKPYLLNANTVWYAAVNIGSTKDIATFIELIISNDKPEAKIISLSFKGRIKK